MLNFFFANDENTESDFRFATAFDKLLFGDTFVFDLSVSAKNFKSHQLYLFSKK